MVELSSMFFTFFKKSSCLALIFIFCFSIFPATSSAQTASTSSATLTPEQQKAEWESELAATNADIAKWQAILDSSKKDTASLQQQATVLNAQIQQAKAFIKQKNIEIAQLDDDISQKTADIASLEDQISTGHDSLAQLLRQTNDMDHFSLPEVVLSGEDISQIFSDVSDFQTINKSMADLFAQIRSTENLTEQEKAALASQKNQETDTKQAAQVQQQQVQTNEAQKEYLIQVNKTNEKSYAQVLAEEQAKAAAN